MYWIENAPAPIGLPVPEDELWVFAYGSLMWDPGFPHDAVETAGIDSWHRSFCLFSAGHRGTPAYPGLVMGLSEGGCCRGLAIRAEGRHKGSTLDYLWRREMGLADGYVPRHVVAALAGGRQVTALTFVADRRHPAYAGPLPETEIARRIAAAHGRRGSNRDYLERTLARLANLGIEEPGLRSLGRAVERAVESAALSYI